MKRDDAWDWPCITYAGRCLLGYTEERVWQLTPREFFGQLKAHYFFLSLQYGVNPKKQAGEGFIDEVPGW